MLDCAWAIQGSMAEFGSSRPPERYAPRLSLANALYLALAKGAVAATLNWPLISLSKAPQYNRRKAGQRKMFSVLVSLTLPVKRFAPGPQPEPRSIFISHIIRVNFVPAAPT